MEVDWDESVDESDEVSAAVDESAEAELSVEDCDDVESVDSVNQSI